MPDSGSTAIIIPAYNHAHFLARAIESSLAQSHPPTEVIVIDDGSSDQPERVAARYEGVRFVRQRNAGLAAARNRGIRETSAPYLLFLDADDRLLPDAVRAGLLALAAAPSAAFAYGAYKIVRADSGEKVPVAFKPVPNASFASFLRGNPIGMHGAVLYRRTALSSVGGFRETLRACEDYDLYLRLARDYPICCHAQPCAEYWYHGGNMSADPLFMLRCALGVLRDHRTEAKRRGLMRDYRRGLTQWKRHYVDLWAGSVRNAPMTIAKAAALLKLAPWTTLRKLASILPRSLAPR